MAASTIPVVVRAAAMAAKDIRQLELVRANGQPLPPFSPGAHIDLHLGPRLVRQYSLCGPANDSSHYLVAVKLDARSRGGSKAAHEALDVGAGLQISPPRNHFPLRADARHSVLVAGGIGITPLLAMARALVRDGGSFELLYFCRSEEHAAFLPTLRSPRFAARTRCLFGLARDAVRPVIAEALADREDGDHLYICGPAPFMEAVEAAARPRWPAHAVHLENFAAPARKAEGAGDFEVRLARAKRSIRVAAEQSIVDALRELSVDVPTSCEQGVCGSCITAVLEGVPEHRDSFLTDDEKAANTCMAICVSRSRSPRLVLDL